MNPFLLEGIEVSLDAWRWLYLRQDQVIKVPRDEAGLRYLNTLVRHGLLVYEKGSFSLTDLSRVVLLKTRLYEEELNKGVPISYKSTNVDLGRNIGAHWIKGKTREKRPFYTNNEIIIFSDYLRLTLSVVDEMSLEMEVLVSQIQKAIFAEGYIDAYPRILQRVSFFEPGVIWFKGTVGDPVGIKEAYYDLLLYLCNRVSDMTRYVKVSFDKDYIVVINPCRPYRYYEDIVAIISSYALEELGECMI